MQYERLKNWSKAYTGKISPAVMMKAFTSILSELGF